MMHNDQPVPSGETVNDVRVHPNDVIILPSVTANDSDSQSSDLSKTQLTLRRNLGIVPAVSYVAGGIIGVGIFVSPQTVLISVGGSVGVALCVWAFCAVIAFCGALTYADYGTRIRKSGGTYTYVREIYGDLIAFVFLWSQLIVVRPMAISLGAMAAAEYIVRPVFLDCPELAPRSGKVLLALCILTFFVFLNSYDTTLCAYVQTMSTVCKLAALAIIIAVGLVVLCSTGGTENLQDLFSSQESLTLSGLTLAVYSCSYAYMGWDNLNIATEEIRKPQRTVPLAIVFGVALTTTVYLLAILSYHTVLTSSQVVSGLAVAAAFCKMTVPALLWIVVPCIGISATGIVNVIIFTATRFNFIGGRDGIFPDFLSMISVSRRAPVVSCLLLGFLAGIAILLGDIRSVLGAYSFFRATGETMAIVGFLRLRHKFPATSETYVVPKIVPIIYLVVHLTLAVVALSRDTSRYVVPLVVSLAGVPLYLLSKTTHFRKGPLKKLHDGCVKICHRLLLCDFASKVY